MNIFINAVALKVAGGKSVLNNFLNAIKLNGRGHTYYIFMPSDTMYDQYKNVPHLKLYPTPAFFNKAYFRYFIDHLYLPSKIWALSPDVIFSMGNIALPVNTIPQILLFQFSYPLYPESDYWKRIKVKKKYFDFLTYQITRKFKYATVIAAQTEAAKKRLGKYYDVGGKTVVIPNAVSLDNMRVENQVSLPDDIARLKERIGDACTFLCLSRYYEHKNIEILVDVAEKIKKKGRNYKILITIENNQGKGAREILNRIEKKALSDVIINMGNVQMKDIKHVYGISDALLLPTLIESFSGTYIEAAYFKKPVFTSDYDFATGILGEDAVYFNPLDVEDIMEKLDRIKDSKFINEICKKAFDRIQQFPNWSEVAESYIKLIENTTFQYV